MKQENKENVKDLANPSAPETLAKPRKEKKEKKKRRERPASAEDLRLPILVELTYGVAAMLLIFVGLAMIVVSFLTGASLLHLVLRTTVAILVMGCLSMLIASQVSSGVLQASLVEQEEAPRAQKEEAQSPENSANLESRQTAEA